MTRYLFGFFCVLALGVMGCGQSSGPVGGSGGDGGVGGDGAGGNGGNGGVVTDCTGEDNFTECRSDGMAGSYCVQDLCVALDCRGLEDGTICDAVYSEGSLGVCEAGECTKPEDCTGLPDGLTCTGGDGGFCEGGECVAIP